MTTLDHTLGLVEHNLSDTDVTICWLIEGRSNNFGIYAGCHVGHFLWTLINEQDDHIHLGVIRCDCISNILQQNSFPCLRLCDDETTLSLTDRRKEINNTHSNLVLHRGVTWRLELELLIGEDRREVVKGDTITHLRWRTTIDSDDLLKWEILIPILWWTDEALN